MRFEDMPKQVTIITTRNDGTTVANVRHIDSVDQAFEIAAQTLDNVEGLRDKLCKMELIFSQY